MSKCAPRPGAASPLPAQNQTGSHSTAVLQALCIPGVAPDIDWLVDETALPRKKVINALGRLIDAKLALRIPPLKRTFGPQVSAYRPTDKGRALIAAGRRVTSGPKGPLNAQRRMLKGTFRARLWMAFRMKGKATIPELTEIARSGKERGDPAENAQLFMRRLVLAGVVVEMTTRAKGYAPTSPGFKRFALVRDLGPLPPVATAKHVFDPNSRSVIPYREQKK